MIWSGLGINYNDNSGNDTVDLPYLYSLGFRKVRMLIVSHTNSSNITAWENKCLYARGLGFYVIFGLTSSEGTLTAANWNTYSTNVQNEATRCQSLAICDEYQIGNEEELHNDDVTLTDTQLRSNIRTLATACQPLFTSGPISCSCSRTDGGSLGWIADGTKGDLDLLGLNLFPGPWKRGEFSDWLTEFQNAFGTAVYLSEWGIDGVWANVVAAMNEEQQTVEIANRQAIIKNSGVTSAYFYNWITADDSFGVKLASTGDHRLFFNPLMTNNGRRVFINNPPITI